MTVYVHCLGSQVVLLPSIILLEDDCSGIKFINVSVLLPSIILLEDDTRIAKRVYIPVLLPSIILLEDDLFGF